MKEELDPTYINMCVNHISGLNHRQCLERLSWCPIEWQEKVRTEQIKIVGIKTLDTMLTDPPTTSFKIVWVTRDGRVFSDYFNHTEESNFSLP